MTTRRYLSIIQNSVKNDGVIFEEVAKDYLYRAKKDQLSFIMHDVEIGLNNSASAKAAISKSGTYAILAHARIPAVEHIFLMNDQSPFYKTNSFELGKMYFQKWNNHVVIKPDNGSQGKNVYKIRNEKELLNQIRSLFHLQLNVAISPYYQASNEYRVVVLLGEAKLFLGKKRSSQQWKHNLINGATVVDVDCATKMILKSMAEAASKVMGLDFCTVDILETVEGLRIIEINEQVMLDEYCKDNPKRELLVSQLYREAILARFKKMSEPI